MWGAVLPRSGSISTDRFVERLRRKESDVTMSETPNSSVDQRERRISNFPDGVTPGSTVLVASAGDPSRYAVSLRALCRYGRVNENAVVVTTTEGADRTVQAYEAICSDADYPAIGLVDTVSERQHVTAVYSDTPVVFTPSSNDLGRLVFAFFELRGNAPSSNGTQHVVVRSLTPLLRDTPTSRVCTALEQISEYRTGDGYYFLGLDYTAHDEETMEALTEQVDGVLWVTEGSDGAVDLKYRHARGRYTRNPTDDDG